MKIGIYGGTYNPIHLGHTQLAQSLVSSQVVDEVWLMVSPQNPLKGNDAADYDHRYTMACLAVAGLNGVKASDFERSLPLPSYTINTLQALQQAYPQHEFSLVIGADNWQRFHRWYRSDEILNHFRILIYRRPGYDLTVQAGGNVQVVDTDLYDVSSTEIRNHTKQEMLSPAVLDYIQAKHLYGY